MQTEVPLSSAANVLWLTDPVPAATRGLERRTMDKVNWRLVPILIVCFLIAYLDRVNVGFANPTMSKDLALSAAAFGNAAGIFFVGYFFSKYPVISRSTNSVRVSGLRGSCSPGASYLVLRPSWSARQALI
jgi:hypothetical protein